MRTRILLLSLFICMGSFSTEINAQNQGQATIDSLLHELPKAKDDSTKVSILNSLSWENINISDFTNTRKYADEALKIAKKIDYKKGVAASYNNIGIIYYRFGNYPEALKYHFEALKIFEETGKNQDIASTYNQIGNIYAYQANYPEALKNYFASLKIIEEIGDKKGIANIYYNIGNVFSFQCKYPEALKNYNASLKIQQEIGNKKGFANIYGNIGTIYCRMGNYPEALKNLFAGLKIFVELGDKQCIASSYINIGYTKLKMQNVNDAKDWMVKGLTLANEIGDMEIAKECYAYISEADSAMGNFKDALANYKMYIIYKDSLHNEVYTKQITQQQMQYDFDKKLALDKEEQGKKDLKEKIVRNGIIVGLAIVLIFLVIVYRQRNKVKKEKLMAEEERKRSDDLLLNILPSEIATEIKTTGHSKAKAYTMVTVMFTDFKDFTKVSEKISAELLVDEIHQCFSGFDKIIQKYKIEKIKTIGDAYLCASGLPVSNYTHATDMVHAAIEICRFMAKRKKEKEAKGEIPFELRVGIHTGPVVAGIVGVKKYAYDIWGDTVNIAARMEQNSEAGKINISGSTYELVKDKFNCVHRGKIEAKNKGEIDMYFVKE